MTRTQQYQLLTRNAAVWGGATLLSFVLPLITDSLSDGRSAFLRVFLHAALLIAGMQLSNGLIRKAIGPPSDA